MTSNGGGAYVPLRKKRKRGANSQDSLVSTPHAVPLSSVSHDNAASNVFLSTGAADVISGDDSSNYSPDERAIWARLEKGIEVDGENVPAIAQSFSSMNLPVDVISVLHNRGIMTPTPIQMQAIPLILQGRDVIGLASTGSGKTLAYVLPLITLLRQQKQTNVTAYPLQATETGVGAPSALILVPTRELMSQVFHELKFFASLHEQQQSQKSSLVIRSETFHGVAVCGGTSVQESITHIREGCHNLVDVVVATPGRLLHLAQDLNVLSLSQLRYLVLDEVDRMLNVELEPQVRQILQLSNSVNRQTLLWSATMPHFLDRLARSAVLNPITIRIGMGKQRTGLSSLHITQEVLFMRFAEKKTKLLQVLRQISHPPVLVFCNSHECVEFVTRVLQNEQFHVASLHGEKSQAYRFQVMTAFREGYVDVLVATDVASRGLDFSDVDHVILFDIPHTIEDYVHRCGRTGRTEKQNGKVTAFLTIDCSIAKELKQLLQETKQHIPKELNVPGRFQQPKKSQQHPNLHT